MTKCQQTNCSQPGISHTFTLHDGRTQTLILCGYHAQELQRTINRMNEDARANAEEEKNKKQKKGQEQQKRQHQASHCRQCNIFTIKGLKKLSKPPVVPPIRITN